MKCFPIYFSNRHMHRVALHVIAAIRGAGVVGQQGVEGHRPLAFRIGYHCVPSLKLLHLHIVSADFVSTCLKHKKHWSLSHAHALSLFLFVSLRLPCVRTLHFMLSVLDDINTSLKHHKHQSLLCARVHARARAAFFACFSTHLLHLRSP